MREEMSQPAERHLTAIEKVWRVGYEREMSCSGCIVSASFRNLQKRSLFSFLFSLMIH